MGFRFAGIEKVFYSSAVMLGSSNQRSVHGPFERFSGPFRELVARFGSVVKFLIVVNIVVFFVQLIANAANFPYLERYLALQPHADDIPRVRERLAYLRAWIDQN